jgi:transposase
VCNILEGAMEVIVTTARDAKGDKARKTDVSDVEWLADLLRHGLLQPSFMPPLPIRALRELTR